jgi:hypothetical protein
MTTLPCNADSQRSLSALQPPLRRLAWKGSEESSSSRKEWLAAEEDSTMACFMRPSTSGDTWGGSGGETGKEEGG